MSNPSPALRPWSRRALAVAVLLCAAGAPTLHAAAPRPNVARIIVQENGATAFGSGSLIDRRDQYGMVITNWHVVRDATGKIEVLFPDGFRSEARAIKLDEDWDLAALVIWRPPVEPVAIAAAAPRPGDPLTICGYGQGDYREATGRCTEFYSPEVGMPRELVELSVEARQGDSGGPILNERGELAGVLFGAAGGTTLGSFAPRVETFLASVAPDIGRRPDRLSAPLLPSTPALIAQLPPADSSRVAAKPAAENSMHSGARGTDDAWRSLPGPRELARDEARRSDEEGGMPWPERPVAKDLFADAEGGDSYAAWKETKDAQPTAPAVAAIPAVAAPDADLAAEPWFDAVRNVLAVVGITFLFLQLVRIVS